MGGSLVDPQLAMFDDRKEPIGSVERRLHAEGIRYVIGVDEAGRGPLAGPVHAAAVLIDLERLDESWLACLDDSKSLSERKREAAFAVIMDCVDLWAIGSRTESEIDDSNILRATLCSMGDAVTTVSSRLGGNEAAPRVIVDGNQPIETELPQSTYVKGDRRSYAIAAASILAKVSRDRLMLEAALVWPEYGFESNKGYGTLAHRSAIAEHGPCPIHRYSFSGVSQFLSKLRAGERSAPPSRIRQA